MNPDHAPICQICAQCGKSFLQLLSSTHMFEDKKMSWQNINKGNSSEAWTAKKKCHITMSQNGSVKSSVGPITEDIAKANVVHVTVVYPIY